MKLIAIFFIFLALLSLIFNVSHPLGMSGKSVEYYNSLENRLIVGCTQLFIGLLFLYYGNKKKEKNEIYTKCPNCKEVFDKNTLKNGKCPNCKNVDTIELEEYYEKFPDEEIE
ncbi:hypothetical protein CRV08_03610 [Halarcobacter ebronensis]|uniref:Uncharacterized protein n=1 Tax=Halarcobacter ebronensis TaxID=1462615 RepID=A0A4Q0YJ13_9BACT|nr:hypothetical protein [Halarcobacter ebronensis]RXJ69109.1 hypothetical protein CRV08_03610 [Halarcobacter ebronensis]